MNTRDIMLLVAAELEDIHATCDRLEVPRNIEDQQLSAAQRVRILYGAYVSACTRVTKGA